MRARPLLDIFPLLDILQPHADEATRLRRDHGWKLPDAFQAALALEHDVRLATRNTNDFDPNRHEFVVVPVDVIDHAQNAFFYALEWVPVGVSALGVGLLVAAFVRPVDRDFVNWAAIVLLVQVATGLFGFALHLRTGLLGPSPDLAENIIYGAPVFAPLLFANLPLLAAIGLWDLYVKNAARERVEG